MSHPLTDEICEELSSCITILNAGDADPYISPFDVECDMRATADWQLEWVIKWLEGNLGSSFYLERHWDGVSEVDVDYVIEDLREAMRPTNPQEENND